MFLAIFAAAAPFATPAAEQAFVEWRRCAETQAALIAKTGEPADVVAQVAMYRCPERAATFYAENASEGLQAIEQSEQGLRSHLMDLTVKRRAHR